MNTPRMVASSPSGHPGLSSKGTSRMRPRGVHVCALVGMIVGATLFGWSEADAVLCVAKNKKGVVTKVTIRGAACKGKESVGDPNALLGITTTTSSTTTTTLPPFGAFGPRVVDSAGNDVGWLTSAGSFGQLALRTIDGQPTAFPVTSFGPSLNVSGTAFPIDDFQLGFAHQGNQCVGDRFLTSSFADLFSSDLMRLVLPTADGKTGYATAPNAIEVSSGFYSQDDFKYDCAVGAPPAVTCDDDPEPSPPGVVTPVGAAFACQVNSSLPVPPGTQCRCIRCCVTREVQLGDPAVKLYPVQIIDLGLGDVTPPFKID